MTTLRLLVVAALLALPLWVASAGQAHACTFSLRDNIRSADLIAAGTVGEMLVLPPESVAHPEELGGRTPVEIKFAVSEYVKGSGPSTLLIYSPATDIITNDVGQITTVGEASGTSCASAVTVGQQYVGIFVRNDPLRYQMYLGSFLISDEKSRSDALATVHDVLAAPGALPPTGSGPPHQRAPIVPLVAASALACIGLATNAAFALRRRS